MQAARAQRQILVRGGLVVYTTHQDLALSARRLHRLDLAEAVAC